jgi:hypothetical protein
LMLILYWEHLILDVRLYWYCDGRVFSFTITTLILNQLGVR